MGKEIQVIRKLNSGFTDAGAIYTLKLINIEPPTDTFFGCLVWKLDNGDSWNFETVTQLWNDSFKTCLEKENLEIYRE